MTKNKNKTPQGIQIMKEKRNQKEDQRQKGSVEKAW